MAFLYRSNVNYLNMLEKEERVKQIVQMNGPMVLIDVAKKLGVESYLAGAILSTLVNRKVIKQSFRKVGSSPLYYVNGQEERVRKKLYEELTESFREKRGVFVTLLTYPDENLRGCIGYPEPIFELKDAVMRAAKAAAYSDPRFNPINPKDISGLLVEISVLTKPELIHAEKPEDYLKSIELGKDGLIVEHKGFKGLLLPQVATEWNFSKEEFISHTCMKAGLPPDVWKKEKINLFKFQAEVFKEKEPNGEVIKL